MIDRRRVATMSSQIRIAPEAVLLADVVGWCRRSPQIVTLPASSRLPKNFRRSASVHADAEFGGDVVGGAAGVGIERA